MLTPSMRPLDFGEFILNNFRQLWCEKLGDTTYLFTVEGLAYSPDYILRIRVIKDDYVEDKAVYLLKADMEEYCREWGILEITPTAEGVG